MPVVDFIPCLRSLAVATPGADLQEAEREREGRREAGKGGRRKKAYIKFHF